MRLDSRLALVEQQVQELYSAETQLILALPRAAGRAHGRDLRQALEAHLGQTEEHIARLERVASMLDIDCAGKQSRAMRGILQEVDDAMAYGGDPELVDDALIAGARRVEHDEMAAYLALRDTAAAAGAPPEVLELIEQTLDEEHEADRILASLVGQGARA